MPTPNDEEDYSMTLFCKNCTDQQLYNVVKDEKKRSDENLDPTSEVGNTARQLLAIARTEYHRRLDERVQGCPTCHRR